ncbi:MAG TPA: hypothetical protein VD788_06895, partial [Candidatus Polarisedimenticolaceae bacterium]|nr:hypothetical protein [Candidatus Polarisedimenticolaceae bacterium]
RDHDEVYYAGCPVSADGLPLRRHGDRLERLEGGYYRSQGRADDTMNLGGVKVGSLEIEQVLERHEAVAEAAAVGVQLGGEGAEQLVAYVVLRAAVDRSRLGAELACAISRELNPLFRLHDVVVVDTLPRTASNKLMRRALRACYPTGA